MRLISISANSHLVDGQVNGKPVRLLLAFEGDRRLRLQVAEDGERMIADDGPLDAAVDLGDYGQIDIIDVTQTLFPTLAGVEVMEAEALEWKGRRVGLKLAVAGAAPFYFWVDGDELHWGDQAALAKHGWLGGVTPIVAERIAV